MNTLKMLELNKSFKKGSVVNSYGEGDGVTQVNTQGNTQGNTGTGNTSGTASTSPYTPSTSSGQPNFLQNVGNRIGNILSAPIRETGKSLRSIRNASSEYGQNSDISYEEWREQQNNPWATQDDYMNAMVKDQPWTIGYSNQGGKSSFGFQTPYKMNVPFTNSEIRLQTPMIGEDMFTKEGWGQGGSWGQYMPWNYDWNRGDLTNPGNSDMVDSLKGTPGESYPNTTQSWMKQGGEVPSYENGTKTTDPTKKSPNIGFSLADAAYDLNGNCWGNCVQRSFAPKHNLSFGPKLDVNRNDGEWSGGLGGFGGYTMNPNYGVRQQGFKGFLGGSAGARFSNFGHLRDYTQNGEPNMFNIKPYANAIASGGYEGEVGSAHSYKNYLAGRRGEPLKWGVGAFAKKDLLGDNGYTFGGYGNVGNLNVTGGYNKNTGFQGTLGFGIPINKQGGTVPSYRIR